MATSIVDICNMALLRLGTGARIDDITEGSSEARACQTFYEECRDQLLTRAEWPFATKYVALGLVQEEPNAQWLYEYRQPVDAPIIRRIVPDVGYVGQPIPYDRSLDSAGGLIWTNIESAIAVYTVRETNVSLFTPLFVDALAWLLASNIAEPLSAKTERADRARSMAEAAFNRAVASDANSIVAQEQPLPPHMAARGISADLFDYRRGY